MSQVRRWRAFAVLAVSFFMTVADLAIVNVALPTIGRKLHMPESSLQWVVTCYASTFRRLPAAWRSRRGPAGAPPHPDGRAGSCSPRRRWAAGWQRKTRS